MGHILQYSKFNIQNLIGDLKMMIEVKAPIFASDTGVLCSWLKKEGDAVVCDEILAKIEADGEILEVLCPKDGMLVELLVDCWGSVLVEQVLAKIKVKATAGDEAAEIEKIMRVELDKAHEEIETLQKKLDENKLRNTLIAGILSANSQNKGVKDYFYILERDVKDFANQEHCLKESADILLELQAVGNDLKMVGAYPEYDSKRIIAVSGGFSAGKSAFISSLFQDRKTRLPLGMEPTTAIPVYVFNGNESFIGCSQNGGMVDLLKIDSYLQEKLSHDFIESFGFNLKSIMPFLFLRKPMKYKHLCLLDTPGYNPPKKGKGYTAEDVKTAKEFIQNADEILWLIGLDTNGTILSTDCEFLNNVNPNNAKPLYIVFNKADLKSKKDIKEVMDGIVEILNKRNIRFQGISAYSSNDGREYDYRKQKLENFLRIKKNALLSKHNSALTRLFKVDVQYQYAILHEMKKSKQIRNSINSLELDLIQAGFDNDDILNRTSKMKLLFDSHYKEKEKQLKHWAGIIEGLTAAIDLVFGKKGHMRRREYKLEDIELDDKYARLNPKDELPEELEDDVSERRRQIDELVSQSDVMKKVYDNARKKGHKKRR